jgi:hypothetical protein
MLIDRNILDFILLKQHHPGLVQRPLEINQESKEFEKPDPHWGV